MAFWMRQTAITVYLPNLGAFILHDELDSEQSYAHSRTLDVFGYEALHAKVSGVGVGAGGRLGLGS